MFSSLIISIMMAVAPTAHQNLGWSVGDKADYNISLGFFDGTLKSFVREETEVGFWVEQNMDIKIQQSKVEILYDKQTGQPLEVLVDGQKQEVPDPSDSEIIEMEEASVSVPAGTFDCIYVKIRDTKEDKVSEVWVNPDTIPIGGMIKTIAPGPLGKITVELTSYQEQ